MSFQIEELKDVEQPRLCDECYQNVLDRKSDTDAQHCVYCKHTRAQAIVTVKDGRVVFWLLNGPMSLEEAEQLSGLQAGNHKDVPIPQLIN